LFCIIDVGPWNIETQNGLKWEIVPAFVAMEDYFGKER